MILNRICAAPPWVGWPELATELVTLARFPAVLEGQNPIRAWEYAVALQAIAEWERLRDFDTAVRRGPHNICDVGGAASNFWQPLGELTARGVDVIDPGATLESPDLDRVRFWAMSAEHAVAAGWLHASSNDIVTCISVIEHVPDAQLPGFLDALVALLAPGGLLVLTTDFWGTEGPDTAHFHWMRERIYTPVTLGDLLYELTRRGLTPFGQSDFTYHGNIVYDYALATLAFTKDLA